MFLLNTFSDEMNEHTAAKNKILFIKCLFLVSKFFTIKQSESEVELGNKTSSSVYIFLNIFIRSDKLIINFVTSNLVNFVQFIRICV